MAVKKNTEEEILKAARKLFIEKGPDDTKMQKIADEAGINKALLYYYFRTKEKLFEAVFSETIKELIPLIKGFFSNTNSIQQKITYFVEGYINLLEKNTFLPEFIFREINRNPERLIQLFNQNGIQPNILIDQFKQEIDKGNIKNFDPKHLLINVISMTVFPFIAKPLIKGLILNNDENAFIEFVQERKKLISEFVLNAILIK